MGTDQVVVILEFHLSKLIYIEYMYNVSLVVIFLTIYFNILIDKGLYYGLL